MRSLDLAGLVVVAGRTLGLEPAEVLASTEFDLAAAEQILLGLVREGEIVAAIDSVFAENRNLRAEVRRLRELLRRHGIEPDGGESRTA